MRCETRTTYIVVDKFINLCILFLQDDKAPVPDPVINRYCWIMSTFTLPKHFAGAKNEEFLDYGVGE